LYARRPHQTLSLTHGGYSQSSADSDEFPCPAQHLLSLLIGQPDDGLVVTLLAEVEGLGKTLVESRLKNPRFHKGLPEGGDDPWCDRRLMP